MITSLDYKDIRSYDFRDEAKRIVNIPIRKKFFLTVFEIIVNILKNKGKHFRLRDISLFIKNFTLFFEGSVLIYIYI